jgi:hypothetical protein
LAEQRGCEVIGLKEAYYFPHFCNARHDRKIKRLTKELGLEGYGIFFMLLEVLREQTDLKYPMADIDLLADEMRTSEQKIRVAICNYGLFDIETFEEKEKFFSPKLLVYLQPYFKMREQRISAGKKSGESRKMKALQQNNLNDRLTEVEEPLNKESKVKESKVKENNNNSEKPHTHKFVTPSIESIKKYCTERKNNVDAEKFFDFYQSKGWMVGKNKMKDWKACIRTWEKEKKTDFKSNIPQKSNHDQRKYSDEFIDKLYEN